jgi:hypothetical protein
MTDSSRRLVLRVTLKLLALSALLITAYALLNSRGNSEEEDATIPPLQLELQTLQPAQPQRIEWPGGPLQLLRMAEREPVRLFFDRGGNLGCPLSWQPPGTPLAPQQPWPGGFRDQCSSTWYRYDGQVLAGQTTTEDLNSPPYRVTEGGLLEIGVNGDNAAPAPPPEN